PCTRKQRHKHRLALDLIEQQTEKSVIVRAKQLYHDREEITVLAMRE
ncbi:23S rRNA (cytidine(2498)-2'-O)-methyltransferase RlmM, partial [Xanthomonas perforans]